MCGLPSLVMADEGKLNNSCFLTVLFTVVGIINRVADKGRFFSALDNQL